jgi:maltooligosyltrehalose trehalohydrolase
MGQEEGGYWSAEVGDALPGARYGYLLDGAGPFPDPCSRSQPEGVHALSEVIDPGAFEWHDAGWEPPPARELVVYECHAGTLTREGTFDAACGVLPGLRALGVNAIELMPVAAFPGRWNWGYDGVSMFAPSHEYGGADGLRRFVDAAHASGLAVILDVVYNHFGPDGNYTGLYASEYTTGSVATPWGPAINFGCPDVRRFYGENLLHWVHEYHLDGFRFDATHAIADRSEHHILAELAASADKYRRTEARPYLIAETHENDVRYLRPLDAGGYGFDAAWADDFHHAARTLVARDREGYFATFAGTSEELVRTVRQGFLYEGQAQRGSGGPRGTPARDVPWGSFVYCLQNHDQVGNRAFGERLTATASHSDVRALTLLLLLLPQVPMLFQGQEYFAQTPFQYFTDHHEELGVAVTEGRRREFAAFGAFTRDDVRNAIPDPQDPATFSRSKLDADEWSAGIGRLALEFHREVLRLRASDPVLAAYRLTRLPMVTAAAGETLVVTLEFDGARRWIALNLGGSATVELPGAQRDDSLEIVLHTDEARFGGAGWEAEVAEGRVRLPAHTGVFVAVG